MIELIIAFLILVGITLLNNKIRRSIFYPPTIFAFIWMLVFFVSILQELFGSIDYINIGSGTIWFIVGMTSLFSIGGVISQAGFSRRSESISFTPFKIPRLYDDVIFYTTLISFAFLIFRALYLASEIESQNFFISLRFQLAVRHKNFGILDYFLVFGLFASLFRLYTFERFSQLTRFEKRRFIISILVSLAFLVLSTGRTYFFFYFTTLFISVYYKGQFRMKQGALLVGILLVIFITVGIILAKGGNLNDSFTENLEKGIVHFTEYFEGPLLAFDSFFSQRSELKFGENSFRFFFSVFHELGLSGKPPAELSKPFVYVPFPANVYTLFHPYVDDFGIIGTGIFIFLLGLGNVYLFNIARFSGNFIKILSSFSYYPLIMIFFQDQYLSLTSFWLQLVFYSYVVMILIRKK